MQVSNSPTFETGSIQELFNNDADNSTGQGQGADAPYAETASGKSIDGKNKNARYVRVWSNGSNINQYNHVVEVMVFGEDAAPPVVSGISITPASLTLDVGGKQQLSVTANYNDGTTGNITNACTFASSDTSIAAVNSTGTVTAVAQGSVTITATTQDGSNTATSTVQVAVPVTGVSLNKTTLTLAENGAGETLTATVAPETAGNKNIVWSSNNNTVATVDTTGLVTPHAPGKATITVTTENGGKTASCEVTVGIPVTGVTLNKSTLTFIENGTGETLIATIAPPNATNQGVIWSSSNTSVATVDNNGLVSPHAAGTAVVTVTTEDGGKTATCEVTVGIAVTGVTLNKTSLSLNGAGPGETLVATVTPANAANQNVTWSSSNTSVATVDNNGLVTPVGAGTATITVTTVVGGKTATCEVIITASVTGITLNKTNLTKSTGGTETLVAVILPANAANKTVNWSSNNTSVATVDENGMVTAVAVGQATITATTEDGNLSATCTVNVVARVFPGGGTGSEGDPYLIASASDLNLMRNYPGSYFKLTQNIDLGVAPYNTGWTPIGNSASNPFYGYFDGNNKTISRLYINIPTADGVGLFGCASDTNLLEIKNLSLSNINVTSNAAGGVGGLVGKGPYLRLINCSVTGRVTGNSMMVGGLVGFCGNSTLTSAATSLISNCASAVEVTTQGEYKYAAGIVARIAPNSASRVTLEYCRNTGTIQSADAGGIVGLGYGTATDSIVIQYCWNSGTIKSTYNSGRAGGIAGIFGYGTMTDCYSSGQITATSGLQYKPNGAGIIAQGGSGMSIILKNCISTGNVYKSVLYIAQAIVAGAASGTISNNYYDYQTTGLTQSTYGAAKSTAQMKTQATFTGIDFNNIWAIEDGVTYPYLRENLPTFTIPASLSVTPATATIAVGGTQQLSVTAVMTDGTSKVVTNKALYTSSDPTVASVSELGLVTINKAGTATVTATYAGTTATSTISTPAANSMAVTPSPLNMTAGSTRQLIAAVTLTDGTVQDMTSTCTFTCTPSSIASVSNTGLVSAIAPGQATITVTSPDGSQVVTVQVSVIPNVFAGGSGIEGDPYLVANASHMDRIRDYPGCYFKLTQDIDLGVAPYNTGWAPIGSNAGDPFYGYIDGNNKTVSRLYINNPAAEGAGLFGYASDTNLLEIKNLSLSNINVTSSAAGGVGGLVGRSPYLRLINCSVTGRVTANNCSMAGGLVGFCGNSTLTSAATSLISNCASAVDVTIEGEYRYAAGIAARIAPNAASRVTVEYCRNTGTVQGADAGGIVGLGYGTATDSIVIQYCWNSGTIKSTFDSGRAGGIAAIFGYGTITDCYSSGLITAISGQQYKPNGAGIIAQGGTGMSIILKNCISTGSVVKTAFYIAEPIVGGAASGTISNNYYDSQTTGLTQSTYGSSKSTAQMKTQATFAGFDFNNIWAIEEGTTYPYLRGNLPNFALPSGISVSPAAVTLTVGKAQQLAVTLSKTDGSTSDATSTCTYTSSASSIASVNNAGLVTAVAEGTATITAATSNGTFTSSCVITVDPHIPVSQITVNPTQLNMEMGSAPVTLVATISPNNATNLKVIWTSDHPEIVSVSSNGTVNALSPGTATITATSEDGNKTAICTVSVIVSITGVELNKTTLSLQVGATDTLVAAVTPLNATNKTVSWNSSNPAVATVVSGDGQSAQVTAVSVGTTTITVTTTDGSFSASCEVEVKIGVTEVRLDLESLELVLNRYSQTVEATVLPANATHKTVAWNSSNTSIAVVDQNGTITAKGIGTAVITATADGKSASCAVTVRLGVTGITLNKTSMYLKQGTYEQLVATIVPADAPNKKVLWLTSDSAIAGPDQDGWVRANYMTGTVIIEARTEDGNFRAACSVTVVAPVNRVTLNKTALDLYIDGELETLVATIEPEGTIKDVTWSSSAPSVASVSPTGQVTPLAPGQARITVTTVDGGKTAFCDVTVYSARVPVTGIVLNTTSLTKPVGVTETLVATISPSNATNKTVVWSTSDPTIATVSPTGQVTPVAVGQARITVTTADGGKTAYCDVTVANVHVPVTGISLDKADLAVVAGGAPMKLTATITPANATDQAISWSSSEPSKASVDQTGLVTGLSAGSTVITATTHDGGKTATCAVTVAAPDTTAPALGSASAAGTNLDLVFNELLCNETPDVSAFTVKVDNTAAAVTTVAINNTTVSLTLAQALVPGQTVIVSYIPPAAKPIRDLSNNALPAFTDYPATIGERSNLVKAVLNGKTLRLTFSKTLDYQSVPDAAAFAVTVNGANAQIQTIVVSGKNVSVNLASARVGTDTVTVSYAIPTQNPLKNTQAVPVNGFTAYTVTNLTPKTINVGVAYEYDKNNRLKVKTGTPKGYEYDKNGNLIKIKPQP
ncbi:MAG: Ig-like domain-containing protein [Solirubrobacterales bacterium]